ncbi:MULTISPECIES: hypothetical protein [unclassified Halomonas]|uniref:hypothetical protein n=1 Tax=unclassified Halomonas TaxID=2609666 RepID=UPI001EF69B91|nr:MULTISPECIES: hypothetical protein [unclassified Halomonas]MCG7589693.1 hypothetical protein [Halomonas sp. McD50-5]MCG7616258.1 hypothetical protein [Halomonas sp. McD50-4]
MSIIDFIKDWVIPITSFIVSLISIGLAIWFSSTARSDAEQAKATLNKVDAAIEGWQKQIISSTVSILDSNPQVIGARATLAKIESAKSLTQGMQDAMHEIVRNPHGGAVGHTQQENLKLISEQLTKLLDSMSTEDNSRNRDDH